MPTVLLRIWPKPARADIVGLEKAVRIEEGDTMLGTGDIFRIDEIDWELPVHIRSSEVPPGVAYALHFEASPREVLALASKGWKPVAALCPTCPRV